MFASVDCEGFEIVRDMSGRDGDAMTAKSFYQIEVLS